MLSEKDLVPGALLQHETGHMCIWLDDKHVMLVQPGTGLPSGRVVQFAIGPDPDDHLAQEWMKYHTRIA